LYNPDRGIATAAGLIFLGNVASRLLGLARETTITYYFGATGLASAYRVADTVPRMVFDLLIGGMISAALVPVFSDYAAPERRSDLNRLASVVFSLTLVVLIGAIVILEFFAPQVAWVLAGGFTVDLLEQVTHLLRLILPAVAFLGLSGITMGLLYALQRFAYPAFVVAVYNASIIVAALIGAERWGIASLAVGVVLGALLQVVLQAPGLRGLKLQFSLDLRHPGLRQIGVLYLPVVLGLVISQAGIILDRNLASRTGEQSISWMANATTLIQLPLGLVVTAISMAVLPSLSRQSGPTHLAAFRRTLGSGLRMVLVLILPATLGLWVLARPIIALLFEHGQFTAADTTQTSLALQVYLLGLPCAAIDQPLIYAFYAQKDTRTPVIVGVMAIGVYLVVALLLIQPLGMLGLVLANSAQWASHALVMLWLFHTRLGGLRGEQLGITAAKVLLAAGLMAVVTWAVTGWLLQRWGLETNLARLVIVGSGGLIGVIVYGGLALALGLGEVRQVGRLARRW